MNDKAKVAAVYTHALDNTVKGSNSIATTNPPGGGEANLNMKQNSIGVSYSVEF